ncbi:MAG: beta-propeller domain-containing protein, partial [Nitrososphaerota archaeon]|nr:beta-propeller domain-containing protein [Nitrososphaerota archaeon]
MTQKEIKNKTKLYTLAAVLSAIILVSAIYTVTTPTVMYGALGISPMKHFNSIDELEKYLTTNTIEVVHVTGDIFAGVSGADDTLRAIEGAPFAAPTSGTFTDEFDYSTTNLQVAGVDEADTVKTDGKYIYALSESTWPSSVQIVNADPKNPMVVGKIVFDGWTSVSGMYLSENGNKLAVLGNLYNNYNFYPELYNRIASDFSAAMPTIWYFNSQTF